jgi:hypothetical protein
MYLLSNPRTKYEVTMKKICLMIVTFAFTVSAFAGNLGMQNKSDCKTITSGVKAEGKDIESDDDAAKLKASTIKKKGEAAATPVPNP